MDRGIILTAIQRIEVLGSISDDPEMLQRTFLSTANRAAGECVMAWMGELGMEVAHDGGGTVRGILPGRDPGAKPLVMGSHIDTVIDAGKYDGALGVIAALAALEQLREEGIELDFPVHVLGFSDEEGVRFQSTYLGSGGVVGVLGPELLLARDGLGLSLAEVLEVEGWKEDAETFFYDEDSSSGYLELHIEQGRVLEEAGQAVAIVSGICGQGRLRITIEGMADHAGTTPMNLRRDAMAGAAECVLAAERLALETPELVATVGMMRVRPGASNAIPQVAEFTVDIRNPQDGVLAKALEKLRAEFETICEGRELRMRWELVQLNQAVPCDAGLTAELRDCAEAATGSRELLGSGAGHDGVMMARAMPIGMVFVRCRAGLSHHPDEYAEPDDIAAGIAVLVEFLKRRNG